MTADVNHDLIVQVLAQIERRPDLWAQNAYATAKDCGTAYCFAGWAATLAGYNVDYVTDFVSTTSERADECADRVLGLKGWAAFNSQAATTEERRHGNLYSGDNELDDIYRISASWMGVDESVLRDKVREQI